MLSYKLADGTEGGSTITGMNSTTNRKELYVFRGNIPAKTLTASTANGQGTSGDPTSQSVTASGGKAPLVVLGGYGSDGTITTRTFSPAKDAEITADSANAYLAYRIDNSAGQDTTVDMADFGNNALQSMYIEMA